MAKSALSAKRWLAAREEWEADERLSAAHIAEKYGTTWRAVKGRIHSEKWTRRIHKQLVPIPKPRPPWRPPVFREEFADQLVEYFSKPAFIYAEATADNPKGNGTIIGAKDFPTLTEFACMIGVTRETLHDWATAKSPNGQPRFAAFSYAYKKARDYQETILVKGGLASVFQPAFAIFTAKNIIGWRNEVEVEKPDDDAYPTREELDRIYAKVTAGRKEWNEAAKNRVIPGVVSRVPTSDG